MQDAFGIVVFVVVGIGAIVALVTAAGSGRAYERIGRGDLSLRDGADLPQTTSAAVREQELRQLLEARNVVREHNGKASLDVDDELARLLAGPAAGSDPQLEAEIRALVVSRNARRQRRGQPALDVDAEVRRRLEELGG